MLVVFTTGTRGFSSSIIVRETRQKKLLSDKSLVGLLFLVVFLKEASLLVSAREIPFFLSNNYRA
jgi:hypothetical protein